MSLLANVSKGKVVGPQIIVIYGNNGVGKTTWAADFPGSLVIDLEDGSRHLDVARIESKNFKDVASVRNTIKEVTAEAYKTLILDSIESLESLIYQDIIRQANIDSIEKYEGGFGKGYVRAREVMRDIMGDLIALRNRGVSSILVGHSQVKAHTDPASNQAWDRVIPRCNDKVAAVIKDLSDNVFYATYKVLTAKDNGKTKAVGDGQRIMYTQWRPGFDGKNRLELPLELPLSYQAFKEACEAPKLGTAKEIAAEITELIQSADPEMKAKVLASVEQFKDNAQKLSQLKNRIINVAMK